MTLTLTRERERGRRRRTVRQFAAESPPGAPVGLKSSSPRMLLWDRRTSRAGEQLHAPVRVVQRGWFCFLGGFLGFGRHGSPSQGGFEDELWAGGLKDGQTFPNSGEFVFCRSFLWLI